MPLVALKVITGWKAHRTWDNSVGFLLTLIQAGTQAVMSPPSQGTVALWCPKSGIGTLRTIRAPWKERRKSKIILNKQFNLKCNKLNFKKSFIRMRKFSDPRVLLKQDLRTKRVRFVRICQKLLAIENNMNKNFLATMICVRRTFHRKVEVLIQV